MKVQITIATAITATAIIISPLLAQAAEFDPTYLISDSEMTNHNSMNEADIQGFLDKQPGTLDKYITIDKEDKFKKASQAFYEIAQRWMINPKYLLTLVQKEQSLIEDSSPKQGQYDRATGYGCPDSGGCDDRWKGFYRQVNSAAAQTRYYQDNINEFHYQPGKTYSIDGQSVTIKNTATAGLYSYTPHIHGNQLFWNLWNKYFAKKWPDGSLLQAEGDDDVYLISDGAKRLIESKAVFASLFDIKDVITVSSSDIESYDNGVSVAYPNFSLVQARGDRYVYMLVDDTKRRFASTDLIAKTGLQEDEIMSIDRDDLDEYKAGPDITETTLYPTGILFQDQVSKAIYYVLSGRKSLVTTTEILNANFQGLPIQKIDPAELDRYMEGAALTLPDGILIKVKGLSTVYVISDGKRLPIFSGEIFERMGYKWANVVTVAQATVDAHQLGQTITGDW